MYIALWSENNEHISISGSSKTHLNNDFTLAFSKRKQQKTNTALDFLLDAKMNVNIYKQQTKAETKQRADTQVETSLSKGLEMLHPEAKHCWDPSLLPWGRWGNGEAPFPAVQEGQPGHWTHLSRLPHSLSGMRFNMANIPSVVCGFLWQRTMHQPNIIKGSVAEEIPGMLRRST